MADREFDTVGWEVEGLAQLLHEAGREAVAKGQVYMKGPGIEPKPFAEWADLSEDAKEGRRTQARYLRRHRRFIVDQLLPYGCEYKD